MKELQRKQGIRRIIYSIPSLIILSIIAFILTKGALGVMNKERTSSERSKDLEEKAAALILREQELREGVRRLETEEGIKDEIREKFSVTEEGELVAVIVDDQGVSNSADDSMLPWYKRLWIAIMGGK
ncbi:MAG: hypothetical protein Q7S49_01850 [bacterium]|nr:hypothetical protein [bacterium]